MNFKSKLSPPHYSLYYSYIIKSLLSSTTQSLISTCINKCFLLVYLYSQFHSVSGMMKLWTFDDCEGFMSTSIIL